MADYLATNEFPGTGAVMQVEINFAGARLDLPGTPAPYFEDDDVHGQIVLKATETTPETVTDIALTKINNLTWTTTVAVPLGQFLRVYRRTDIEQPKVDFVSLQVVTENDLDTATRQTLYAVMEARDQATTAQDYANFAQEVAVEANLSATTAVETADAATLVANTALSNSNAAILTANDADAKADQALDAAAAAEQHASNVEVLAQQAGDDANAAAASADAANTAANQAITTANGIDGKAQLAIDTANAAANTAGQANATANGIAGTANSALSTAQSAQTTANQANATANQAASDVAGALTGKQDTNARLTQIGARPVAGSTTVRDLLGINSAGNIVPVTTTDFVASNLMGTANAGAFRNALSIGVADTVTFGNVNVSGQMAIGSLASNSGGTINVNNVMRFLTTPTVDGTIQVGNQVLLQVPSTAADNSANLHLWARNRDGTERGLIYFDSGNQMHLRTNNGNVAEGILIDANNKVAVSGGLWVNHSAEQTTFFKSGVPISSSTYGTCQLQLQAADGGIVALGFHAAGARAAALLLNTDNNLYLAKNDGNVHLVVTTQTIMGQLAPLFTADVPGSFGFFNVTTGTTIAPNGVIGGGSLKWSSHNSVLNQTVNGSWRCLGYGNSGGSSLWVRYA